MERVFRVSGRIVWEGVATQSVVIALVDEDLVLDDLIGFGFTDGRGEFRLAFTAPAFRQEPLEVEATPDLYVVVSLVIDGRYQPVHLQRFPRATFASSDLEDLGDITLATPDTVLPGVQAIPGYEKRAKRLAIDDDLLARAMTEVAPIVELVTGWNDLLRDVNVLAVTRPGSKVMEAIGSARDADDGWLAQRLTRTLTGGLLSLAGLIGLYEPLSKTIYVDRDKMARQNYDGLKVILGHELVHSAQFQRCPGVLEEYLRSVRALIEADEADRAEAPDSAFNSPGARLAGAKRASFGFMANLEGYAYYIENDVLRRVFNCATPLPHQALWEVAATSLLQLGEPTTEEGSNIAATTAAEKDREYLVGMEAYRARQVGAVPALFDPSLRPG